MDDDRFLSPAETKVMMELARKLHAEEISLPPEIREVNRQIAEKMRQAEIFFVRLGAVDHSLLNEIVHLRFVKDGLYANWTRQEARGVL